MHKILLTIFTFNMIFYSCVDAKSYKGQKEYKKKCRSCHGGGQAVAASKTISEWTVLLVNKGKGLADLHVNNEKAKESVEYFTGSRYAKKSKHFKDFMVQYAEDSGNVPACN
ncbi:MAG: cytochrome c [Campylobacterota bacterium]|nr:cytochrome c [Campylobacterota bacterium]